MRVGGGRLGRGMERAEVRMGKRRSWEWWNTETNKRGQSEWRGVARKWKVTPKTVPDDRNTKIIPRVFYIVVEMIWYNKQFCAWASLVQIPVPGVKEQNLPCELYVPEDHTAQCPQKSSWGTVSKQGLPPSVSQVAGESLSCVDIITRCFQHDDLRNSDCLSQEQTGTDTKTRQMLAVDIFFLSCKHKSGCSVDFC